MARKRSKSLDGFPLPIPPEPKTIKLTVIQKSFICQKELLDCPLRKGKPSSIRPPNLGKMIALEGSI